jgi:hypothetical protein
METKAKIESLLKEKSKCEELERCLDLYQKIDRQIESEPTFLDKLKLAINPLKEESEYQEIDYKRTDIPGCELRIKIKCDEVLEALRDYYGKKIIELTEND